MWSPQLQPYVNNVCICAPKRYFIILYNTGWYLCSGILNTLRPRRSGRHFADDIFKCIFWMKMFASPEISLKFVCQFRIKYVLVLDQIIAWCCPSDKPLSDPMLVSLPTQIWVTRPQWINMQHAAKINLTWCFILYAFRLTKISRNYECIRFGPIENGFYMLKLPHRTWNGHPWQLKHHLCQICRVSYPAARQLLSLETNFSNALWAHISNV